ncbi:ATP-binding protein [Simiduia curdlanivorans]|uniref:histidine kinase n=1 Tax=Simiduia curdlanivorans TaxID=1492769 RepID=A0ABV8V6L7_9GAMM|nr:ATP-binding protein [Simiduia curdlanivorans]MDN3640512.1 ATP-binding protein [Simiduia curdlanivorans]
MQLTRQLVLVGTLTLILPWSGLQFIAEMEASLRDGQTRAMKASAQAVAKLVASDPNYFSLLSRHLGPGAQEALYAHPLMAAPIVDGYDDEWRHFPFAARRLTGADRDFSADLQLAFINGHYYGFLRVQDRQLNYHNPSRHPVASGDYVQLLGISTKGSVTTYKISASAPGKAQAYREGAAGRFSQEHSIKAYWQERAGGYQIEFQFPEANFGSALALAVIDADVSAPNRTLATHNALQTVPSIVRVQPQLENLLAVFAERDQRLYLLSVDQWLVADAGHYAGQYQPNDFDDFSDQLDHSRYQWLWRLFIRQPSFPALIDPAIDGRLSTQLGQAQASGLVHSQWYRQRESLVARVVVPITVASDQTAGFVAIEQATDSESAASASALWRLLRYSLLSVSVIGLALIGYASWLSWRVRRLSRAVENALGEQGAIEQALPENLSADELGDLSRSFSRVLGQLHEYTSYLKTLSSKLSHELRTPLAVVKTSLDNLQHETLTEQRAIYSERAQAGANRLSGILNAMSAASRLEESLVQSEFEMIELGALITELGQAYSDIFARAIDVEIEPVDCIARVVPELLVQLLDKLVDNAVDFCPPDGRIVLQLTRKGDWFSLSIDNDGPLLPNVMQQQLFDSLVSVRATASTEKAHLGLGLHIVRLITLHHKGKVLAANRSDKTGVVFTVLLPAS